MRYNKQLKSFRVEKNYQTSKGETNKYKRLEFKVNYKPAFAGNQRIAEKIVQGQSLDQGKIIELVHDDFQVYFRVSDFKINENVHLVYTGLLTDPEILSLYTAQETSARKAVIATCKETQLDQLKG